MTTMRRDSVTCPACGGSGEVALRMDPDTGQAWTEDCRTCDGRCEVPAWWAAERGYIEDPNNKEDRSDPWTV